MGNGDFIKELLLALKSELIRYRFMIVALCGLILVSVLVVGMSWPTFYTSTAQLVVDDSNIIQPLLQGRAEIADVDRSEEARQRVYSRRLLERVAERLGYTNEDSNASSVSSAVNALKRGIVLQGAGRRSPYFTVSYSHPDPQVSYDTTNVLVEEFIELHESSKREEGEYAFDFINKQVELYRKRLEKAEVTLKDFKTSSPDITEAAVQGRIGELNSQVQNLKLNIQELETKIESTRKQLGAESEMLTKQAEMHRLRQQKLALETELAALNRQYQDSYPDIVSLKQQIKDINLKIWDITGGADVQPSSLLKGGNYKDYSPELLFDELRKQLSVSETELIAQKRRLTSIQALLEEEYEKADIVSANQAKLADLTRDYQVTKEYFEEMLSRKENAELSMAITRDGQGLNYKIVEPPVFPLRPSGLTFLEFLMVAPLLAIGVPIGLVLALILVDPRVRIVSALRNSLGDDVHLIAVTPHFHTKLSNRMLRKDMILLAMVMIGLVAVYAYFASIGLALIDTAA